MYNVHIYHFTVIFVIEWNKAAVWIFRCNRIAQCKLIKYLMNTRTSIQRKIDSKIGAEEDYKM